MSLKSINDGKFFLSFFFIGTRIDRPLLGTQTEKRIRGEEKGRYGCWLMVKCGGGGGGNGVGG